MDSSNLLWSKQLRRDYSLPQKHTVCSLQRDYHFNQTMIPNRKYKRPPRMSELVREVRYLKQEALEKINLEAESQKTFESMQNQINLLRKCFESFTSMIVDECEDLRNDQLKSVEDVHQFAHKYNASNKSIQESLKSMELSFKSIVDNLATNTSNKLINLQKQIDELRNIMLLQHQEKEKENFIKHLGINDNDNKCHSKYRSTSSQQSQYKTQCVSSAPSPSYLDLADAQAITALTSTVAEQQVVIDELKRKLKHIDRTMNMNKKLH